MNITDFLALIKEAERVPPHIRRGQHAFNVVERLYPDIASDLRGSSVDPFHNDELLPEFWDAVFAAK